MNYFYSKDKMEQYFRCANVKYYPIYNIYFLDRNILSIIKYYNENNRSHRNEEQSTLDLLLNIDRISSIISPVFSSFEGSKGKMESYKESEDTLNEELSCLKQFFKKAIVDPALDNLRSLFLEAKNSCAYRDDINNRIEFLKDINSIIVLQTTNDINKKLEKTILVANKYKLGKFDPIVVSVLYCICENSSCRDILKPKQNIKKTKYYNAVSDIKTFSMFAMVAGNMNNKVSIRFNAMMNCHFISRDKALNEFIKYFNINKTKTSITNDFVIKITISFSAFGLEKRSKELDYFYRNLTQCTT